MEEGKGCAGGEVDEEDKIARIENELENWEILPGSSMLRKSAGAGVELKEGGGFGIEEELTDLAGKDESIFGAL